MNGRELKLPGLDFTPEQLFFLGFAQVLCWSECVLYFSCPYAGLLGGRVGVVVRALAFHQCGPCSISALGVKCGLSLLVLYSAMRGFSPGSRVFPSHQKPTFDLI